MDNIQLVDCFERLHQHLLRHEPHLEKSEAVVPYAYRSQSLSFFLTHLVALLTGLDGQTAEGRRRIRRLILELDDARPAEYFQERLMVRDKGGVLEKPIGPTQKKNLRAAIRNLKNLEEERRRAGTAENSPLGIAFDLEMDRLEHLPARIAWLHEQIPCLSHLNAFRFLNHIGYPVMVPDSFAQTFFFRLGLIKRTGDTLTIQFETCDVGVSAALALKRPVSEINLWVRAYTGAIPDQDPLTALCRRKPHCDRCSLQNYCHYYRFRRPVEENAAAPFSVKQWRPTDRPRERLAQHGAHALEDSELLAIVLRTGSGKWNVLDLARRLLEKFGTLQGIEEASLEELQSIHGIGQTKATDLKAVFELGRRQAFRPFQPGDPIASSDDVFRSYRGRFDRVKQEEFLLLMLNNKHQVIREEVISRGGLDVSVVHPREVFKAAIRASAAAVIFVHNHPSGNPEPSHDDYVITQRLEEAAALLQIRVLDHVIIGANSYYSFTEGETVTPAEQ